MNFSTLSESKTMTDFKPLQAWKYNPGKIQFADVIAPPYDVISSQAQQKLYERSPYNCIRLILNREEASDTDQNNRYTRARDFFRDWQNQNIITRETQPSFYLYRQTFAHPLDGSTKERTALLGRLKLEPFEKGIVIPHEKTLSKPKADRTRLLEATQTNFSPIFGLYEDNGRTLPDIFQKIFQREPFFSATDDEGVRQEVWIIQDTALLEHIHSALGSKKIYIADGHHRYQTALDYSQKIRRERNVPENTEMPSDYVYMALVRFHDPGLIVLPTHRILMKGFGADNPQALSKLQSFFKVQPMGLEELKKTLRTPKIFSAKKQTSFGLVFANESFLVTMDDLKKVKAEMPAGKPDFWYQLDVNLLNYFVFAKIWNTGDVETALRFTRYEDESVRFLQTGEAQAAFLLEAPQVESLREMGSCHELMPQKSTYFYPKLASGLLFYEHAE